MKHLFLLLLFFIGLNQGYSQVTVTNNQTIEWYVQNVLLGTGVTISNIQYNAGVANIVDPQVGQFSDLTSSIGLPNGLIMGSGDVTLAAQPNTSGGATLGGATGIGSDPDLASITPNVINDECVIEFDFIPTGDSIIFSYVFASEEYEEYVCSSVNDAFGFFLTGTNPSGGTYTATNIALIPDPLNPGVFTNTPVSINTVNQGQAPDSSSCAAIDPNWYTYSVFYAGLNTGTDYEYDGRTVVLQCKAAVNCGETYHIKLAIGDAGDGVLDSGVFLEGGSFSSPQPIVSIRPIDENGDPIIDGLLPEGCINASILLIKPDGYTDSTFIFDLTIGGTAINGIDYTQLNPPYTIPIGQDTLEIVLSAFLDGVTEGNETLILGTTFITPCGDTLNITDTLTIIDISPDYNLIIDSIIPDACDFDSILVIVSADGGVPNIHYNWLHSGETNDSIWVLTNTTTYYSVLATDYCGITSLDSIEIIANNYTLGTVVFIEDTVLACVGQNGINIAIDSITNVDPNDILWYLWLATGSVTDNANVFPTTNETWYHVQVATNCDTILDSVLVQIDVAHADSIIIIPTVGCAGQGSNQGMISVFPSATGWNYTLFGNATTYGPTTNNVFGSLTGNLSYNLLATNPDGCVLDTNIFVPQQNATLNATFITPITDVTCFGLNDGGAEIQNIIGGINMPNGGPFDIVWTHTSGTSYNSPSVNTNGGAIINTLSAGNWQVQVTEQTSGCTWSHLFTIGEANVLTETLIKNDPHCFGFDDGSIKLNTSGGTAPFDIKIFNILGIQQNTHGTNVANNLIIGTYSYTIEDANGCQVSGTTVLDEPGEIGIFYDKTDILCFGRNTGAVNINTIINYTGDYDSLQFFWTPSITGNDGHGKFSEITMPPDLYEVNVVDQNGCSNVILITIKDTIPITIELGSSPAYCRTAAYQSGNGIVHGFALGGAGNFSYQWINIETQETVNYTTWPGLSAGAYKLVAIDQNNCIASQIISIDSVNPKAKFEALSDQFENPNKYEGTEDLIVNLVNQSEFYENPNNPNSESVFEWNLFTNDPEGGNWFLTHHIDDRVDTTYGGEQIYNVCLVASNFNNCKDTVCKKIIVHKAPELTIPNVFTPGQSPNNTFFFPSQGLKDLEATFFNRYGIEVYRLNSFKDEWDGTNAKNGKNCSDGVYFFTYKAVSTNGTEYSGEGHVTLIRYK